MLKTFRSHGWPAKIVHEIENLDCVEVTASRGAVRIRIAVLYSSSGISNVDYKELASRVDRIFFKGQPHLLDSFARGVSVPVEPLDHFFPFFIQLSRQLEPDRSPTSIPRKPAPVRRLTAENPIDAVMTRLQQFTSETLARNLVKRRAEADEIVLTPDVLRTKATGVAYSMRSALDYIDSIPRDPLNKRVLGLYYGTMALAQAEMLAAPSGPTNLGTVEAMTRDGHGLYTTTAKHGGFANLHVGVLANGFFPQWMKSLGYDTSDYPIRRPRSPVELGKVPADMVCLLPELFASMPEIDDLFGEVVGSPPGWISVAFDQEANAQKRVLSKSGPEISSTYALFLDSSGKIAKKRLTIAGWPLAEIQRLVVDRSGHAFRARVDHVGHDNMWTVLPTHSSPFSNGAVLVFPTVGRTREYRTIAAVTLYSLSIMARYLPRTWRSIEGGDQDHYLALVQAAMAVWERLLPEHFLESITGETLRTAQPGSWTA